MGWLLHGFKVLPLRVMGAFGMVPLHYRVLLRVAVPQSRGGYWSELLLHPTLGVIKVV